MSLTYIILIAVVSLVVIVLYNDKIQAWLEKIIGRLERLEDSLDAGDKPDAADPSEVKPVFSQHTPEQVQAQVQTQTPPDANVAANHAFNFNKAVTDFNQAGLMPIPDEAIIHDVCDDWDLQDTEADHIVLLVAQQETLLPLMNKYSLRPELLALP